MRRFGPHLVHSPDNFQQKTNLEAAQNETLTLIKPPFLFTILHPILSHTTMADKKELASSLSKLSGSLRGISSNKDFHFYNNFDAFKLPVTQISSTSQLMLDAIAANSSQLFGKQLELDDDDDDAYDWLVNVNDEVFERFDFAIDEFEKVRESGEIVTVRAENGEGESLSFSDVKVAKKDEKVLGAKPKIPFHIPSIVKPQKQYRILVNNSKEPFQHVWLQRSEDGSRFIHPLVSFIGLYFFRKMEFVFWFFVV